MWCTRLPGAAELKLTRPRQCDGTGAPDPWSCVGIESNVQTPPPESESPEACDCVAGDVNNYLNLELDEVIIGEAIIGDDEDVLSTPELIELRDSLYEAAEAECLSLLNVGTDFSECEYVIDANLSLTPPVYTGLYKEGAFGDCSLMVPWDSEDDAGGGDDTAGDDDAGGGRKGGLEEMPGDSYQDYYSLSSVIEFNSLSSVYEVDRDFFDDVYDNPEWLFSDGTRFVITSAGEYKLVGVFEGTVADALGLQDEDRIQSLNAIDVTTIDGMLTAHQKLKDETDFLLVVSRGSTTITLSYELK